LLDLASGHQAREAMNFAELHYYTCLLSDVDQSPKGENAPFYSMNDACRFDVRQSAPEQATIWSR
jgi:hypothetical protein